MFAWFCSANGIDASTAADDPDVLRFTKLLSQTKTANRQLGVLGDTAKTIIGQRRELQSKKGDKVS